MLLGALFGVSSPAHAGLDISYDFCKVSPCFSRYYDFTPTSNEYYRNVSFSLSAATLLKITYSQEDTSGSLVRLEDEKGSVLGNATTSSAGAALGTAPLRWLYLSGVYGYQTKGLELEAPIYNKR